MGVWPRPQHMELGEQVVWFSAEAACQYRRLHDGRVGLPERLARLQTDHFSHSRKSQEYSSRKVELVFERTKAAMLEHPFAPKKLRGQDTLVQPLSRTEDAVVVRKVEVEEVLNPPTADLATSEWYSVHLGSDGKCLIQVSSDMGINWAMATLLQLFYGHLDGRSGLYCESCPLTIQDVPLFKHRGLNLDISRNIIYPVDVRRVLEGMWLNKMNKLHLHASDSQSWPLEIPSMPDLAKKGAYDASQIWTVADVQEVQKFGADRDIEVYFEIDLPGHTASIHHSFPELIVAYKQEPWDQYAMEPPAGQLKLKSDGVRNFISRLLDDLLPRVSKHSNTFHLGGDEFNKKVYTLEEGLESDSPEKLRPLLQNFFDLCVSKLNEHDLNPVLWEDVLLDWDIRFPKSTIFQAWKSRESLSEIVERGHRALFGPCQYWYLDCGMGTWLDPDPMNPDTPIKHPFLDWCSPYKSWRTVYAYDPFEGIDEDRRHLNHGGEIHLWAEMVDSVCLDFMLWPRVAAAAEVLWSGPSRVDEGVTRRLAEMRERLVLFGIKSGMVQMEWSLRNPGCSSL